MAGETGLLTLEMYLRGCVGFEIPGDMITAVAFRRGLSIDVPVENLEERDLDLAEAELLYRGMTLPSVRGSVEHADGNWKQKEGNPTINQRRSVL